MANNTKRFRAALEPLSGNLGWVVARIPFDIDKVWKKRIRLRVKVEVGDKIFRTSLFADSNGRGHFVLVNKQMQKAAGVGPGGMIDLAMEPDLDEREAQVPAEMAAIFKGEKALGKWYTKLNDGMKRWIGKDIEGVKSAAARERRAEVWAERLMLTMEGEKALPPILEVAFRRVPAARKGWEQMTPRQRQGNLLAIFYYKSPEAQQKRTGKVIEDCLKVVERKG